MRCRCSTQNNATEKELISSEQVQIHIYLKLIVVGQKRSFLKSDEFSNATTLLTNFPILNSRH